ncbi:MAG: hypothetical protein M3033_02720 [Acidobacteriota bacterium]|nr:hypothetical protein [Acidobacteriota bacterium]
MEILIVGIVVVALMVFVSTRIKKSAAQAFEPEFIERDEFTINKPEGFLTPIEARDEFLFEAYSREFGEKKARNIWQARAHLSAVSGLNFVAQCEKAKQSAVKILSERVLENSSENEKIFLLESERTEETFPIIDFWKIVESNARQKTYSLQISVLAAYREIYIDRINEMINSFRLE